MQQTLSLPSIHHNQRKNAALLAIRISNSFLALSPQQKSNCIVRFYPAKDELIF
ncbi:MAG TPA: hypothetical protein DEB17_08860 [Chlorobaculum sp.]|uniref:Uncharacterized protein n=1 Tax=Chlorobaculum tepidum (strain ATCC 49652 / DSM 12025 / NBRC 103806 / TLS) TaxID=194439 RepID=Q8KET6_CHLTE|nr:hypothetical protein CT0596 [Chlorobaculum tepidum TLS]HBU24077.1 hypothetical protein [Chlorobaculum sp.]